MKMRKIYDVDKLFEEKNEEFLRLYWVHFLGPSFFPQHQNQLFIYNASALKLEVWFTLIHFDALVSSQSLSYVEIFKPPRRQKHFPRRQETKLRRKQMICPRKCFSPTWRNRVGRETKVFWPTFVSFPLTLPYVPFGIRRFNSFSNIAVLSDFYLTAIKSYRADLGGPDWAFYHKNRIYRSRLFALHDQVITQNLWWTTFVPRGLDKKRLLHWRDTHSPQCSSLVGRVYRLLLDD